MTNKASKIPTNRLSRFGKVASLATRIGGNIVSQGTKQLIKGQKPNTKDLLLTPDNILKVTNQLAHLRGAAMKIGQMISMDSGDLISPELADILARLRADANPMLPSQLTDTMSKGLGQEWKSQFMAFNYAPIASASIGQVHKAITDDGVNVAVKVQYPGVKNSIDSDVTNVSTLLNIVGLIPKGVDLEGLLEEARHQLHDEANYQREAAMLEKFHSYLGSSEHFVVPKPHLDLSSDTVLTMSLVEGIPIESIQRCELSTRNHVMTQLLNLLFKELFEFKLVQTDPNFANYLYNTDTGKIVLLDFGATREYKTSFSDGYRRAFQSVINQDMQGLEKALSTIGFFNQQILSEQKKAILDLVYMACEPMLHNGQYDFGNSDLATRLREAGRILSFEQNYWHTPPADALFLHRKIGGLYLLASRLNAKVDVRSLVLAYL
ncbi:ABC1 kinase family protein [Vibrio sonorensis]|uniref:ABC1 kinase family protein n=1 Tax=Vibrio sonorensis TaxID=1004316 RepID=UPI0008DA3380|nr:AarF/ABC1/UbiB kinase family protein [Vibrio sonorensis]